MSWGELLPSEPLAPPAALFQPEDELTYAVACEDVSALRRHIERVAREGITLATGTFRDTRTVARVKWRTYLYLQNSRALPPLVTQWTDRLIFERKHGHFLGRLSSKCWRLFGNDLRKCHCGDIADLTLADVGLFLARYAPPIESALVKMQRRYSLRALDSAGFRISLDTMVAVRPEMALCMGAPFVHLELESRGQANPAHLIAALGEVDPIFERLTPLSDSKRDIARSAGEGVCRLSVESALELRTWLEKVFDSASAILGGNASE
jgi:hypothetical protein